MDNLRLLRITGIATCVAGVLLILFGGIKTPTNFRILSDFIQNILIINIIFLAFLPKNREVTIALIIGIFTMFFDFFLETTAVYLNWWYPLGGTQFPPLLVIPLEMVISFFIIGTAMGVIFTFPERLRDTEERTLKWLKPLFRNPKLDWPWRILLILGNALIGTNGDYTAGPSIWVPGPFWHPIFTFFVWFGGGLITLLVYFFLKKKIRIQIIEETS